MKKYFLLALVIPTFFIASKTAQATTYVKKTDAVQNFSVSIPATWKIGAIIKGSASFLVEEKTSEWMNRKDIALLEITAYPFTPNEKVTAIGNPTLFVQNFFKRMKFAYDWPPTVTKANIYTLNGRKNYRVEKRSTTDKVRVQYDFILVDTGYYLIMQQSPDASFTKNAAIRSATLRTFTPTSRTPKIFASTPYSITSAGLNFSVPNSWIRTTISASANYSFGRRFYTALPTDWTDFGRFYLPYIFITVKDTSALTTTELSALQAKSASADAAEFIKTVLLTEDSDGTNTVFSSHVENYGAYPAVSFRIKNTTLMGSNITDAATGDPSTFEFTYDVLHILRGSKRIEVVFFGSSDTSTNVFSAFLGEKSLFFRSLKVK